MNFADQLDPFVRGEYDVLWNKARKRFIAAWRTRRFTAGAKSIEEMISSLRAAADQLDQMRRDGIALEVEEGGQARLVTTDPKVAERFGMVDEFDFWDPDGEADAPFSQATGPDALG